MNKNYKKIFNEILNVNNFPKRGVNFKDITPIFIKPEILKLTINELVKLIKKTKLHFDYVVGLESRGFLLGVPIAMWLNLPFVPIRKKNKLPRKTISIRYCLEYGKDILQIHKDDIKKNKNILIVDDIVATGNSLLAAKKLINCLHAKCDHALVIGCLSKMFSNSNIKLRKNKMFVHYLFKI